MRFRLNTYATNKKGKIIKKREFESPMEARQSSEAQKAVYYEIIDLNDKRIIEIKV
jgi:hypothetical protein